MRGTTRHTFGRVLFAIVAAVASWLPAVPIAAAQTQSFQGQDAVYNSSMQVTNSPSFIDASMFANAQNPNICALLKSILTSTSYPATGRVAQTMRFVLLSRVPRPSSAWAGFFHS
jgi:hypothetical protein